MTCACLMVVAPPASAQTAAQDPAAAQALFEEGRSLMQQKKYDQACAKFAESQRLGPASGTLLNLGECHAKANRTASAWAAFNQAIAIARSANQTDREQYAKERVAEIEGSLVKVALKVDAADTKGLVVKRDNVELGQAAWGTPVPVDPGPHVIEASAPGKKTWRTTIEVGSEKLLEVPVPALADAEPGTDSTSGTFFTQKRIGLAVGGLGIVFVAVGAVFGIDAIGKNADAKDNCRTETLCSPRGLELTDDAKSSAAASTIFFVVGTAALTAGAILFFTAPDDQKDTKAAKRVRFAPVFGAGTAGVSAVAAW